MNNYTNEQLDYIYKHGERKDDMWIVAGTLPKMFEYHPDMTMYYSNGILDDDFVFGNYSGTSTHRYAFRNVRQPPTMPERTYSDVQPYTYKDTEMFKRTHGDDASDIVYIWDFDNGSYFQSNRHALLSEDVYIHIDDLIDVTKFPKP